MKSTFTFLVLSLVYSLSFALQPSTQALNYYGKDFQQTVSHLKDKELKSALNTILKSGHAVSANSPDEVVPTCEGKSNCYKQTVLGYNGARKWMFGTYYLKTTANGGYSILDKYCERVYTSKDFGGNGGPAPGVIPDGNVINTEHTWPQSKFTGKYPTEMQKSDIHHLFPTDNKQNSLRGNYQFGEVVGSIKTNCAPSRFGDSANSHQKVFEPPTEHKGHVARALFYFSTRYEIAISPQEEEMLRKWDVEHPVDAEEMERNDGIYKIQGNRNPFIDFPELSKQISDF